MARAETALPLLLLRLCGQRAECAEPHAFVPCNFPCRVRPLCHHDSTQGSFHTFGCSCCVASYNLQHALQQRCPTRSADPYGVHVNCSCVVAHSLLIATKHSLHRLWLAPVSSQLADGTLCHAAARLYHSGCIGVKPEGQGPGGAVQKSTTTPEQNRKTCLVMHSCWPWGSARSRGEGYPGATSLPSQGWGTTSRQPAGFPATSLTRL